MRFNLPKQVDAFPIESQLCLTVLIEDWERKARESDGLRKEFAKNILKQLDHAPELREYITDMAVLEKHQALVDDLMAAVLPTFFNHNQVLVASAPYQEDGFYHTKAFDELFTDRTAFMKSVSEAYGSNELVTLKTIHAMSMLLKQFYNHELDLRKTMVYPIETSMGMRYFKLLIDQNYMRFRFVGDKLPKLTESDIHRLEENLLDLTVWESYFNTKDFIIEGFGLFQLIDVTEQELMSSIKFHLLEKDGLRSEDKFNKLEGLIRNLLGVSDVQLGVAAFHRKHAQVLNYGKNIHRSFLLPKSEGLNCQCSIGEMYDELSLNPAPRFFADLKVENPFGDLGDQLLKEGIRSMVAVPLLYHGQLVGMLEMASARPRSLNTASLQIIEEVSPLFSMAVQRGMEELENKIQRIIKEQYTAIHDSVEWAFVDSAIKMIEQEQKGHTMEAEGISFEQVYPLYGTSDVRGSSHQRNLVIKADLQEQLNLAAKVINSLFDITDMPVLKELRHRVTQFLQKLDEGLYSGDEFSIIEFLQAEVEPFFRDLVQDHNEFENITNTYWREIDQGLGFLYKQRKAYETSLTMINDHLGQILDREELRVQRMFPHYFEKYHTDGIEYNIYIGQSMAPHRTFNNTYLQNLRLWQLEMAIEMARESHRIREKLPMMLELTHLILLQSNPLSIRFRQDEKQFDVDGAYNVRYEIVKKRIDKAVIKGTSERLTQPDKVAVVYSYDKDLNEYFQYIDFLKNKGLIEGEVEELELEDLQGVYGLKALRFTVKVDEVEEVKVPKSTKEQVKA